MLRYPVCAHSTPAPAGAGAQAPWKLKPYEFEMESLLRQQKIGAPPRRAPGPRRRPAARPPASRARAGVGQPPNALLDFLEKFIVIN
ncbi:hypothetical protein EVAR_8755_1 [Eumeta japonica]|uniref:Uncharacterized protein n=1 Tax=Eumeta variegata TaxID=151549 RepID=A0A4C1TTP2_EUMVA|nr:hypothetical protein EVAR_8755_1 [Eumeta japonica]